VNLVKQLGASARETGFGNWAICGALTRRSPAVGTPSPTRELMPDQGRECRLVPASLLTFTLATVSVVGCGRSVLQQPDDHLGPAVPLLPTGTNHGPV
jgi:hypothetical protein